MNLITTARSLVQKPVAAGKAKIADAKRKREQAQLLTELGEARYTESKGVATSAAEIERLIGQLDALEHSSEVDTAAAH